MEKNIFSNNTNLDLQLMQEMWAKDQEAAIAIYEKHLQQFSQNIHDLRQSFLNHDIYDFRECIRKCIPAFHYLGLTELSSNLKQVEANCITAKDLILYEPEIQDVIKRIISSKQFVEQVVKNIQKAVEPK